MEWYRKAADQGNADAQYYFGRNYDFARGVKQDKTKAKEWYRKAAVQGHKEAQKRLDEMVRLYYYAAKS